MGVAGKLNEVITNFRKWYENSPLEGLEISESNYKYVKVNSKGEISAKHMQKLD